MSNLHRIYPEKSELILLYEVATKEGIPLWAGEGESEAVKWLRLNLSDQAKLLVSAWDSDEETAHMVGQTIDITNVVMEAFKEGLKV